MNGEAAEQFGEVLSDVAEHLRFLQTDGVRTLRLYGAPASAAEKTNGEEGSEPAMRSPEQQLQIVAEAVRACKKCPLWETRTQVVPGQGAVAPEVLFVGEAPGAEEDRQGVPFVGRAGELLTNMITAMGYSRDEVFIGNILKCRPPGNRTPKPEEMAVCLPFLREQIAALKPRVIVALGATAVKGLLDVKTGITKLRGTWMSFEGIDLMPTYHPAYLLRSPGMKRDVWNDLKAVLLRLGKEPPARTKTGGAS